MKKPNGLLKGGLIVNIVLSGLTLISGLLIISFTSLTSSIFFVSSGAEAVDQAIIEMFDIITKIIIIFTIILPIGTILASALAFRYPTQRIVAGILGIITNLIGGVLIFCGEYEQDLNIKNNNVI